MNRPVETERLDLRPFTADDADGWHGIWGDPEVIWWGASESLENSTRSLLRLIEAEKGWPDGIGWLAVREKGRDGIVGDVLVQPGPFPDEGTEIGWHFRTHVQGRGYATEAARAAAEQCFALGACDRLYALVEENNAPSLRVASKLGMTTEKTVEHAGLPHRLFLLRSA